MKYKVGDKVRVRKDLKENTFYNGIGFVSEMEQFRGKVVEIDEVYVGGFMSAYYIKEDEHEFVWDEEMFEPVITNFDKVKEEIIIDEIDNFPICKAIHRMRNEKNCCDRKCADCKEWLKQPYEEPKKEILDRQEKEYLSAVIKPFRSRINYIIKSPTSAKECIGIFLEDVVSGSQDDVVFLPYFKKNSMYKGMKVNKEYTLEELGL